MTQATNTVLGEIKLAGDLSGSNDALLPQLTSTGVTAGSYVLPKLTIDAKGRVTSAANSTSSDILALMPDATTSSKGVVRIGSNINVSSSITAATQTVFFNPGLTGATATGFASNAPNYSLSVNDGGTVYNMTLVASANSTIQQLIDNISTALPSGSYVTVDNGNLKFLSNNTTITVASDSVFRFIPGFQSIGAGTQLTGANTISVSDATTSSKGVVRVGSGLTVVDGTISVSADDLPVATASTLGVVRVGSGLTVSGGLLNAITIADATTSSKGIVQIGSGISVNTGVISIPTASAIVAGAIIVGPGLVMTDGVMSLTNSLATASTPGVMKVGNGLTAVNGVVSVNAIASSGSAGLVKIGAGVTIDGAGVISTTAGTIADATTSSKGIVQIGSGISVTGGVISLTTSDATASTKGVVQVSTANGLTITSGVVGVRLATNTAIGVVKSADTNNITITDGLINVGPNVARLDVANVFTKTQTVALSTITSGASITPDFSLSNTFYMDATSNFTLNAPTNVVAGGTYYIIVKQDATGSRAITWNSVFKFRGVSPALSTSPNKSDIISVVAQSSTALLTELQKGYA